MKASSVLLFASLARSTLAFAPSNRPASIRLASSSTKMIKICEGVEFDVIAREWRCKWSPDGDKASLVAAQKALETVLADVKKVDGVKNVERIVCGGCLDFKVITSLSADKYGAWEAKNFAPEADFIEMLEAIPGISTIEKQTYTKMPM